MKISIQLVLRIVLLLGLCLAYVDPPWEGDYKKRHVFVLVDESRSVDEQARVLAWKSVVNEVSQYCAECQLSLLRFAGETVVETKSFELAKYQGFRSGQWESSTAELSTSATDIEKVLQQVYQMMDHHKPSDIYLISDAIENRGSATPFLRALQQSKVPVYLVPQTDSYQEPSVQIVNLEHPSEVSPLDRPRIRVDMDVSDKGDWFKKGQVIKGTLSLVLEGEKLLERPILLDKPGISSLDLTLPPTQTGDHQGYVSITYAFVAKDLSITSKSQIKYLVEGNSRNKEHRFDFGFQTLSGRPVLWIQRDSVLPEQVAALSTLVGGIDVLRVENIAQDLPGLFTYSAIVLWDVAVEDLPADLWQQVISAVRDRGLGLLVFGDQHSFSLGGYRRSAIEVILPVLSEPPHSRPIANVQFALDKSGSMAKSDGTGSYFQLASLALVHTVEEMENSDHVGVVAFDKQVYTLVENRPKNKVQAQLASSLVLDPAGATNLSKALLTSMDKLEVPTYAQRILVVVTDGEGEIEKAHTIAQALRNKNIQLIYMNLNSTAANSQLSALVRDSGGRLLQVGSGSELPKLMKSELRKSLSLYHSNEFSYHLVTVPESFPKLASWPRLQGLLATTPKPEAQVMMQADNGWPLVSAMDSGLGRVISVTGGATEAKGNWLAWEGFADLFRFMLTQVSLSSQYNGFFLRPEFGPQSLSLYMDVPEQQWFQSLNYEIAINGPNNYRDTDRASMIAPGRYKVTVPASQSGYYHFVISPSKVDENPSRRGLGENNPAFRYSVFKKAELEQVASKAQLARKASWLEQGLLKPFSAIEKDREHWPRQRESLRGYLIAAIVLLYLALLISERYLVLLWDGFKKRYVGMLSNIIKLVQMGLYPWRNSIRGKQETS